MEYNKTLQGWKKKELIASDLVNISNKILIDKGVELVFLRKHLIDLGHPVIGDNKYFIKKKSKNNRLLLHAYEIKFMLNSKKYSFKANIPDYFKDFLIKNNLMLKNF